jgi:hypothetical protein
MVFLRVAWKRAGAVSEPRRKMRREANGNATEVQSKKMQRGIPFPPFFQSYLEAPTRRGRRSPNMDESDPMIEKFINAVESVHA